MNIWKKLCDWFAPKPAYWDNNPNMQTVRLCDIPETKVHVKMPPVKPIKPAPRSALIPGPFIECRGSYTPSGPMVPLPKPPKGGTGAASQFVEYRGYYTLSVDMVLPPDYLSEAQRKERKR